MAKAVHDVIDELQDHIRRLELSVITMTWPDFYKLNEMERFKQDRRQLLIDRAAVKGLILGFGDNAIVIARDRNFAPIQD